MHRSSKRAALAHPQPQLPRVEPGEPGGISGDHAAFPFPSRRRFASAAFLRSDHTDRQGGT
jgi:hypothetical protein